MVLRLAAFCLSLAMIGQAIALGQTTSNLTQRPPQEMAGQPGTAGAIALVEKLQSFDEQAIEIRWGQGGWQLWAGSVFLKDFGKKEQDARISMHLIRDLHLD